MAQADFLATRNCVVWPPNGRVAMAPPRLEGRLFPCAVALAAVATAGTFLAAFTGPTQRNRSAGLRGPVARQATPAEVSANVRRRWLRADLEALADSLGAEAANSTRSDLELLAFVTSKVKSMEEPDEDKMAELADEKSAAVERAAELEKSLAEATQRADQLAEGVKELGELVGVGGFGGIFSFFMSETDFLKETKAKVAELTKTKTGR
uniref:Uncharacterized protein n=1 Tax=Alexandrium andersonii TaxID=327968 RepID=A0A7S2FMV1_9DINO